MTLDNLVGKGLREEPTAPEEIQRLLHKASTTDPSTRPKRKSVLCLKPARI